MKYIFVLVEFKHTEFFTSYGDCLLNTNNFKFLASRSHKIRLHQFQSFFVYCSHSDIDFT